VPLKAHQLRAFGIDPEKTAVLFLSDAVKLIHRWIVTVYSREVHSSLGVAPAKAWMDRAKTDIIELCPNLEELSRACARTATGVLTREGIKLHGLTYRSSELAIIREAAAQCSAERAKSQQGSVRVKLSWDPEDISKIYVWNPKTGTSLEVPCTRPNYTRGLSKYMHDRLEQIRKAENKEFQSEAEMCANRVALARELEDICERRVVDRKRLQRIRHPERQAQQDLVRFDKIGPSGEVRTSEVIEVAIDTIADRDFTAPREKRPLLKDKTAGRHKAARQQRPPVESTAETRARIDRAGSLDFTGAFERARQALAGAVDDGP
jgi:putative transposase